MAKSAKRIASEIDGVGSESPGNGSGEANAANQDFQSGNTNLGLDAKDGGSGGSEQTSASGTRTPESSAPIPAARKRGRPKGSGTKKAGVDSVTPEPGATRKPSVKGIGNLASVYLMGNNFVAMRAQAQELVIGPEDAKFIAEPLAEVLAEWGIHLDGGENPYMKLATALMVVYGMRGMALVQRKKTEARREVPMSEQPMEPVLRSETASATETQAPPAQATTAQPTVLPVRPVSFDMNKAA